MNRESVVGGIVSLQRPAGEIDQAPAPGADFLVRFPFLQELGSQQVFGAAVRPGPGQAISSLLRILRCSRAEPGLFQAVSADLPSILSRVADPWAASRMTSRSTNRAGRPGSYRTLTRCIRVRHGHAVPWPRARGPLAWRRREAQSGGRAAGLAPRKRGIDETGRTRTLRATPARVACARTKVFKPLHRTGAHGVHGPRTD